MAPKHPTPVHEAPASLEVVEATSSSEEEEIEESSSEDDHTLKLPKRASPPQPTQFSKAKMADPTNESESDSGTESDSESEDDHTLKLPKRASPPQPAQSLKAKKADSTDESESDSESEDLCPVKPIASKPMEETSSESVKSKPKFSSSTADEKASSKRGSEVEKDEKNLKRLKTKDLESNGALEKAGDTKKQLFQRLWSEDDKVALLKGLIAFTEETGIDYVKDMNAFHDFIKKALHFVVSLSQLKDKVCRLKKKFEKHVSKGKEGENKTFPRQHDQTLFDLSKKIWGSRSRSQAKAKTESGEREKVDIKMGIETENGAGKRGMVGLAKGVTMEDYVMKRGLEMVDEGKKSEMEEKWRKLHVAELELFVKRKELIAEQGKLLLASYKTSV